MHDNIKSANGLSIVIAHNWIDSAMLILRNIMFLFIRVYYPIDSRIKSHTSSFIKKVMDSVSGMVEILSHSSST